MNLNQKGQEVKRLQEEDLLKIREYFKRINKVGFLNFINIGVNVGMRISDLAQFRFEMITRDWKITVKEVKTGKVRTVVLNNTCQKAVRELKDYYKELGFKTSSGYFLKAFHTTM